MHIHGNQFDPNIQLNSLDAAVKAEAKQQAEETRKKLLSAASALVGETDCVVRLSGEDASREHAGSQERDTRGGPEKRSEEASSDSADATFSDWA